MKKFSITFALGAVVLFASNVAAHGRFLSPPTRIAEGDENQGFTKTRSPTTEEPCAGVPFQGVKSQFSPGQTIPISWEIGAAHRGKCSLQLSKDDGASFQTIKEVPNCADSNGIFNSEATLPSDVTCEKCILQWRWDAELTKELYLNCADISIGGGGAADGGAAGGGATGGADGGAAGGADGGTQSSPAGESQPQPNEQPPPPGEPQPPQPANNPPAVEIPTGKPSTEEPSTAPSTEEPSTAPSTDEPSTAPSTEEPSTAPSTAPSNGSDPDCDKPDGSEQPQEPQPPTGEPGNTGDGVKRAKRYRRSTLRARPRRLRRSA